MSHNNISTFFSSTDIDDLQENADSHNYYLSLIVNNNLDTCAKIAFIGEQEIKQDTLRTFFGDNGKVYKFKIKNNKKEKILFVYNCKVELDYSIKVDSAFEARTNEIIKNYDNAGNIASIKSFNIPTNNRNYYDPNEQNDYDYEQQSGWFKQAYQKQSAATQAMEEIEKIEQLLVDCLAGEYGSKLTMNIAIEHANSNYEKDPIATINLVTTFLETLGNEYFEEDFLASDEFFEAIAESLYMYEDDFPVFINALTDELFKTIV